ncbi:MAG: low-specificity L-threonine aldolase [Archangium sp.]|nr:low-specificity L-threonine aldolase [Archangium sp.]
MSAAPIDLRSDTVTRPTAAMREAMVRAEVGDDVFGDDTTVNRLQETLAGQLGFEAGLFFPSGTQCNLAALMAHCQRGDEFLVGQEAHTYLHEGGGAAVLGSIQSQPLAQAPDGTIPLASIEAAIKPADDHHVRTRLLALENTIGGKVLPQGHAQEATTLAHRHGLATHLDGARLFNAAVKQQVEARVLVQGFDSVSVCLSKGLGAPVGSVLVGTRALIKEARRWRKVLGGGMRQAGILAAAGLYALEHHVARLAEDHSNAQALAGGLRGLPGLEVEAPETNIVWVNVAAPLAARLVPALAERGVLATGTTRVRFVTHLDVSAADVARAVAVVREVTSPSGC